MPDRQRRRPRTTILILFMVCAACWIALVRLYVNQRDLETRIIELEDAHRAIPIKVTCEHP